MGKFYPLCGECQRILWGMRVFRADGVDTWDKILLYHYDYELVKKRKRVEIFGSVNCLTEEYNFRDI